VIALIETAAGIENVEAIMATPGSMSAGSGISISPTRSASTAIRSPALQGGDEALVRPARHPASARLEHPGVGP